MSWRQSPTTLLVMGVLFLPLALLADAATAMFTLSEYRHGCGIRIHVFSLFFGVMFSIVAVFSLISWWTHRRQKPVERTGLQRGRKP